MKIRRVIIIAALVLSALIGLACEKGAKETTQPGETSSKSEVMKPQAKEFSLSGREKQILLDIARKTLDQWVKDRTIPDFDVPKGVLRQNGAAFVTLRKNGKLRGCIGHIIAREPLYKCVKDMAVSASTHDRRFPPVKPEELDDIMVEVSVLTPPKRVDNISAIQMGRHGVIMEKGRHRGVYLPQVAGETGWDKREFLSNLCANKAGLPPGCYQNPSVNLYTFRAIVFEEKHDPKSSGDSTP